MKFWEAWKSDKAALFNGYEDGYIYGQQDYNENNEKSKFQQGFQRGLARGKTAAEKGNEYVTSSQKALITKLGQQYAEGFKIGFRHGYEGEAGSKGAKELDYHKLGSTFRINC